MFQLDESVCDEEVAGNGESDKTSLNSQDQNLGSESSALNKEDNNDSKLN